MVKKKTIKITIKAVLVIQEISPRVPSEKNNVKLIKRTNTAASAASDIVNSNMLRPTALINPQRLSPE